MYILEAAHSSFWEGKIKSVEKMKIENSSKKRNLKENYSNEDCGAEFWLHFGFTIYMRARNGKNRYELS
jgi:hypothetical protein